MKQKFVVVRNGKIYKKIFIRDILHCTSKGTYTDIKTTKQLYCEPKLLKVYEVKLVDNGFFRVSRSNLVNMDYCVEINTGRSPFLSLENGEKIQISIRRLPKVIKAFRAFTG